MSETAIRRALPHGYDNEHSPWFVLRPLRSYYQTVNVDIPDHMNHPLPRHEVILDAALDWCERDLRKRGGYVPD